jgi:hypothetical protein
MCGARSTGGGWRPRWLGSGTLESGGSVRQRTGMTDAIVRPAEDPRRIRVCREEPYILPATRQVSEPLVAVVPMLGVVEASWGVSTDDAGLGRRQGCGDGDPAALPKSRPMQLRLDRQTAPAGVVSKNRRADPCRTERLRAGHPLGSTGDHYSHDTAGHTHGRMPRRLRRHLSCAGFDYRLGGRRRGGPRSVRPVRRRGTRATRPRLRASTELRSAAADCSRLIAGLARSS